MRLVRGTSLGGIEDKGGRPRYELGMEDYLIFLDIYDSILQLSIFVRSYFEEEGEIDMQTFLPYPDFVMSAQALDDRRLNKQIIEAAQILTSNISFSIGRKAGWQSHPATKMWRGYNECLALYHDRCLEEWRNRGHKHKHSYMILTIQVTANLLEPRWLGNPQFHLSHKSNLIRKYPEYYRPKWPDVPDDIEYVWPVR